MTKFYADTDGRYLGGYDGAEPPAGAIEVPYAPDDARQVRVGQSWGAVPPEIPESVSRRQIMTGLALVGWITEQEALDALATGARPAAVGAVIGQLPEADRFAATMKWVGFQAAYRDDAMVAALAATAGKTEQDVDEFFAFCASIA